MRYGLELGGDGATGGTGVLSVSAGAQAVVIGGGIALGYAADTAGTISVSGAHSTLDIGSNEVDVGIDGDRHAARHRRRSGESNGHQPGYHPRRR